MIQEEGKIHKWASYTKSEAFMLNEELKKYMDIDCYNKICALRSGSKELTELCNNMIDDINNSKGITDI